MGNLVSKLRIHSFSISLDGYGAESAEDEILVGRLAEQVRGTIQSMLERAVRERGSVWFG